MNKKESLLEKFERIEKNMKEDNILTFPKKKQEKSTNLILIKNEDIENVHPLQKIKLLLIK